jgi:type II secretory pathway component PulF
MSLYYYKAYTVDQKIIKGAVFCANTQMLYAILKDQNLRLIKSWRPVIACFLSIVTLKDLKDWVYFSTTLLKNNVSLREVLSLTAEQTMNCKLKEALYHTLYDVEHGFSLSKAIEKHEKIFTHMTVLTLGMAERTGNLVSAFEHLYAYFDHQLLIKNKISAAIRYPLFIFIFLLLMIVGLNTIFVPELIDFFQSAGHVPDALNLWFSIFDHIYVFVLFIFVIFLAYSVGSRAVKNTHCFDKVLLKIPFAKIVYDLQIANFLSCLSLLLESGIDLKEASKTSIRNMRQGIIKKSLYNIEPLLQKGHSLSFALMSVLYIDNVTIRFLKIGEKAGEQSKHLVMCSQILFDKSYYKIHQLTSILQPLCLLLIGGLLLWVATTLIIPLYTQFSGVVNG